MAKFSTLLRMLIQQENFESHNRMDGILVRVPTKNGRTQEVLFQETTSATGEAIIAMTSEVGPSGAIQDLPILQNLLKLNLEYIYSRTGIRGDRLVVGASTLVESADSAEVLLILREVSYLADWLEEEIFGVDLV